MTRQKLWRLAEASYQVYARAMLLPIDFGKLSMREQRAWVAVAEALSS